MRNTVIGIIVGLVVGIVIGTTTIAPRLPEPPRPATEADRAATDAADQGADSDAAATVPYAQPQISPPEPPPSAVAALDRVSWSMSGRHAGTLPLHGTLAKRLEAQVRRLSGGTLQLHYREPSDQASNEGLLAALAGGEVEAIFAGPALLAERAPAALVFAGLPFGPEPVELLAWHASDEGRTLLEEIFAGNGIHAVACGLIAAEGSGWHRRPINSLDDLSGLGMAVSGLPARVLERFGVEAHDLPPEGMFAALEAGKIDAAEFSMPAIDARLGFHRFAPHVYFPSWHRPASLLLLMVNLERWNGLDGTRRAWIEAACGDNLQHGLAEAEAAQFPALKAVQNQGAVIHRWPGDILDAFQTTWDQVAAEQAAADADFRKAWQSLKAFRQDYAIWRGLGQMER